MVRLCQTPPSFLAANESSVPSSPFCQEFDLIGLGPNSDNSDGAGVLKNFECGSTPLTQFAEASFVIPSSSSTSPTVVSASTPLASATNAAAPVRSAAQNRLRLGLGIAVPITFAIILILFYFFFTQHGRHLRNRIIGKRSRDRDEPEEGRTAVSKSKEANTKALEPGSGLYKSRLRSLSSPEIDKWKGFLSLYGRNGVWLRDLLMLVYAIYSPVASFCQYRHWDDSGLRQLVNSSESDENFLILLKDASSIGELAALEQTFVSLGVIDVRSSLSGTAQGSWDPNNRLWFARSNGPYGEISSIMLCRDLLALYSRIPDRDVHLLAERQRELFYYHAHAAIVYMFRMVQNNVLVGSFQGAFFDVTVQVLSQRYLGEDDRIMEYIRGLLLTTLGVSQEREVFRTSFHVSQFHYRQVMLLLADLRILASRNDVREASSSQYLLQEKIEYLQNTISRRDDIGHKAWGMIGYALAELMDIVETAHNQETADKVVQCMREWCDTALKSRTPIEMAALCSVLVRLRAFDELDTMPQEHHLMCGYYLARTGFQLLAPQFILSGIHYCAQEMPGAPIWRYYLEFWTIAINQGHWDEAESWLLSACEDSWQRNNTLPGGGLDMWKYSGELGEFMLNVTSLISDCYAARGQFLEAESMLTMAIGNTFPSQDRFVKITRVALWSRLLNVQMELRNLNRASIVAFTLCCELQEPTASVLGSQIACWAIQEILICTNELVREDMHLGAYHILYLLGRPKPLSDGNHCAFVDGLPEDLIALIHQRWEDVKSAFDPDDTINERHHRVLDMLAPIGCLTGSLKVLHAVVDLLAEHRDNPVSTPDLYSTIDPLPHNLRSYLQLRKDVIFTKVIEGTMIMETSMSEKSVFVHRAAPAVDNAPVKATDSPSMLEIARHIARDHPYTFPAPAIRAEGISPYISETPAAEVPSLSSLTRVKREQQTLKVRRIRRALSLGRRYKNLSTLLKLPEPPKSIRHSTNQLERGQKSEYTPRQDLYSMRTPYRSSPRQDHYSMGTPYTSYKPVEMTPIPAR